MDLSEIGLSLQALFADLPASGPVRLVGEGYGSYAVSVDGRWIFRIARNAETLASHQREVAMLPLLRGGLPLPVPQPRWHCGPSEAFPFGVMGYPMLPGVPWTLDRTGQVDLAQVADQLAEFLSELHGFPLAAARNAGVEAEEPHALVDEVLPALPAHLDGESVRRFYAWWERYAGHPERYAFTPRLLHGDLWCENILLQPDLSHAAGVVDFGQMRIGDPVAEFAALRYVGDAFLARVRRGYPHASELETCFDERLRAAVILRELGGLRYALRYPDADEVDDAVDKVTYVLNEQVP